MNSGGQQWLALQNLPEQKLKHFSLASVFKERSLERQ
jgi:hypothetical protein